MDTNEKLGVVEEEVRAPGRPPLSEEEPTVRKTITFPASYLAKIQALGNGQISPGVRRAVDLAEQSLDKADSEGNG